MQTISSAQRTGEQSGWPRLMTYLARARRRRLVRDMKRRAEWVAEAHSTPPLGQWTNQLESLTSERDLTW